MEKQPAIDPPAIPPVVVEFVWDLLQRALAEKEALAQQARKKGGDSHSPPPDLDPSRQASTDLSAL
jgi:hypothetical protein